MNPLLIAVFLIAGLTSLYFGAEFLVRGGASLAIRLGLPVVVIGLTIMGYGTGTPELVVSMQASFEGNGDIALGNVIGSNIANTSLIVGCASLFRPIFVKQQFIRFDGPVMVAASLVLCLFLAFSREITRWWGGFLLLGFIMYTAWTIYQGKKSHTIDTESPGEVRPRMLKNFWLELVYLIIGFCLLFLGGKLFLEGAIALAQKCDISNAVIGLTIVALGTSLPELATSVMAVIKKHEDIALGNVVGSNIFNVLAVVGVAAGIRPIQIVEIHWVDYLFMTLLVCALWWMIRFGMVITRWEGGLMLLLYFAYITYLVSTI